MKPAFFIVSAWALWVGPCVSLSLLSSDALGMTWEFMVANSFLWAALSRCGFEGVLRTRYCGENRLDFPSICE